MVKIIVKELPEIGEYILSRNLDKQYRKVKNLLKEGNFKNIYFKLRQPKKFKVYQFRINNKYRGFGVFRDTKQFGKIFVVTEISDHQDF